jgi:hypothetical protein
MSFPRVWQEHTEMKLTAMIVVAAIIAVTSRGAKAKTVTGRSVTVYCRDNNSTPERFEGSAMMLASEIFLNIGVRLHWRLGEPSRREAGSIQIEVVTGTPETFMPGALAYALPYEGVHIRIFWDRISSYSNPGDVLAHVMAHEITHILQGEARHSAKGIMKAKWSPEDLNAMAIRPLSFSDEDVSLIYRGMDRREGQALADSIARPARAATTSTAAIAVK